MKPFLQSLFSIILLVVVFTFYGIHREHGDANAGSMYGLIVLVPGCIIIGLSMALYYTFNYFTKGTKWNKLKEAIHLIFLIALFWLDPTGLIYPLVIGSSIVMLLINLSLNAL